MNVGSPCSNIFQYDWDGLEWHGIITAPSLPFGTPARLVAHLSIGRALPTVCITTTTTLLNSLLKNGFTK